MFRLSDDTDGDALCDDDDDAAAADTDADAAAEPAAVRMPAAATAAVSAAL